MNAVTSPTVARNMETAQSAPLHSIVLTNAGGFEAHHGESFICIRGVDALDPFLISLVSNGDYWAFVGSNSPFTAGRSDPDQALFPYQTVDKILQTPDSQGVLSLFHIAGIGGSVLWEPWQTRQPGHNLERNLYKNDCGTAIVFEEINHDLGLRFSWKLTTSEQYGLVRQCRLENSSSTPISIRYLDGWHRLIPPGVTQETYSRYSYLAAAYMRHELDQTLGIFTLYSGVTDRAEPSESLKAACAWSLGLNHSAIFLSTRQIAIFRENGDVTEEREIKGEMGAYLCTGTLELQPLAVSEWTTVAATGLDHQALVNLKTQLASPERLANAVLDDARHNTLALKRRIAGGDGIQATADHVASIHHFANVLFNSMRGGIFQDSYRFPASDFSDFLRARNSNVHKRHEEWLTQLPPTLDLQTLQAKANACGDPQLHRLAREYLPLTFSRRHGDPSRPWNRFSIHIKDENGTPVYSYQGNWRDIFQNWESLAQSYPEFLDGMIAAFLNASTADGYNPYRITRNGIDWEVFDPKDPWSNIGYWGDHQIVYLLRLLESKERVQPGALQAGLNESIYSYAQVPYAIGSLNCLLADPHHSIMFNGALHEQLMARAEKIGNDGKLQTVENGEVRLVTLAEKLLVPVLVKLSNFVPGGGVWLNTQRPEWNDANNALAGWGLSVVTVGYLRRYLTFLRSVFPTGPEEKVCLSANVAELLSRITSILKCQECQDNRKRYLTLLALGNAGAAHRQSVYTGDRSESTLVPAHMVHEMITNALETLDTTLRENRRADGMYHSYHTLGLGELSASVNHLQLMLEGQVAILSSGLLSSAETISLLEALRKSALFRADQYSYLLYPDMEVPPFLSRNTCPQDWMRQTPELARKSANGDRSVVVIDSNGAAHFQAALTNTSDLSALLDRLSLQPEWSQIVEHERAAILNLWESVFHHKKFTGRSGGMFAFEGLGSIYWHMVAKLLVAVQESYFRALQANEGPATISALADAYYDVRAGLGFTKTAKVYGAFPTDPYSHTPRHHGAQQPGMTGQVKEEILTRMGELGVSVAGGRLRLAPSLLRQSEFNREPHPFHYFDLQGKESVWQLHAHSLAFTYCQTPICYQLGTEPFLIVERIGKSPETIPGNTLSSSDSRSIFKRDGFVQKIIVSIPQNHLYSK
ncbi:MAG: hypothetical protein ACFUZC_15105 [Chthoniobacteraceae bacterium]